MSERAVTFDCRGDVLMGILHEPEGMSQELGILIVVGGPQYRVGSHRQFVQLARRFSAAGYPTFRFDYRGMGDSSGEPRKFEAVDEDIRAALDSFMVEMPALRGLAAFGLCDAASALLMYCSTDTRLKRLILANPWVRTDSGEAQALVRHYYGRRLLQRSFWAKVFAREIDPTSSLGGYFNSLWRSRRLSRQESSAPRSRHFLARMKHGLGSFGGAVLLLLSERDLTAREFDDVSRSSLEWVRMMAKSAVSRVDLPNADHTFSSRESLEEASNIVVGWLSKEAK